MSTRLAFSPNISSARVADSREKTVQSIQNLRQRRALTKAPGRQVAEIYTITVDARRPTEGEPEDLRVELASQIGRPVVILKRESETPRMKPEVVDDEIAEGS